MDYNFMDEKLIEINMIRNLEYVSFYDLTVSKKVGNITRNIIAPALMIKADGKTLNYSIMDKHFVDFVHKVISVYHKEKNMPPLEGAVPSLMPTGVVFDNENSKKILEDASFLEGKEITGFYDGKDGYDSTLVFQEDEMKSVMDIVRYVVNYFVKIKKKDAEVVFSDTISGSHNRYSIDAEVDKEIRHLHIHYRKKSDSEYQVSVGNLAGPSKEFLINIRFADNRVSIVGKYQDLVLNNEFKIDKTGGSYLNIIYRNGKIVVYDPGDLNKVDANHKNLTNLDNDNEFTWYELPWNAYLGFTTENEDVDEATKILTNHVMYLDVIGDNFYKREFYTKKLLRERTETQNRIKITVDELRKITYGFKNCGSYLIETSFKKALGDGEYQEKFNNKYFYHIVRTGNLSGVKRESLIPVAKDIVTDRVDLINENNVKRIGVKK